MEKLISTKEASEMLGYTQDIKYRFVRDLWKSGKIEGAKIGKRLMFKESSIEDYVNKQFELQNKKRALR